MTDQRDRFPWTEHLALARVHALDRVACRRREAEERRRLAGRLRHSLEGLGDTRLAATAG